MIDFDEDQVKRLTEAFEGAAEKIPVELKVAVGKASRKMKSDISKGIRDEIRTKKAEVDKSLKTGRPPTIYRPGTEVTVEETGRIGVKHFGARQTRKGVSVLISKRGGRGLIPSGFMGPSPKKKHEPWKGHAFKRRGTSRLKIDKLHGPSPWGVFVKKKQLNPTVDQAEKNLAKQIDERIRIRVLRLKGLMK